MNLPEQTHEGEKQGRLAVSTGAPWESQVGYSRAVRVGDTVYVSGTAAASAVGFSLMPDARAQADETLDRIEQSLAKAGASKRDVVMTGIYLTRIADWPAVGEAHALFFGDARPATTLLEVNALIDPALVVEMEAVAIIGS